MAGCDDSEIVSIGKGVCCEGVGCGGRAAGVTGLVRMLVLENVLENAGVKPCPTVSHRSRGSM